MLLTSCSVKEDRTECPCYLSLDLSEVPYDTLLAHGYAYLDVYVSGSESVDTAMVSVVEAPIDRWVPARKGSNHDDVICGDEGLFVPGQGLGIPLGHECPPLWSHCSDLDASGELSADTVHLHKQYCRLDIEMLSKGEFEVTIKGTVNGYDCHWSPSEGDFECTVKCVEGKCHVNLPRQKDASLTLRITSTSVVWQDSPEFSLGNFLEHSGYDWQAADLEDVTLQIDYSRTLIKFSLTCWPDSSVMLVTV